MSMTGEERKQELALSCLIRPLPKNPIHQFSNLAVITKILFYDTR